MPVHASDRPLLFIKKIGGLALLLLGAAMIVLGYTEGSNGIKVFGGLLLAGGIILLVLKIYRRNQP
jgi:hypothetical protein